MSHISDHDLLTFIDVGRLSDAQERHLESCLFCKRRREWMIGLRKSCAALPPLDRPRPRATEDARRFRHVSNLPVASAAAIILAALGVALWSAPRLDGHRSELSFEQENIRAGSRAPAQYTPSPWLAGQDSVIVRAEFRTATDPRYLTDPPVVSAGVLHSDGRGRFRGSVEIPAAAVHGIFSVESADGEILDANQGRLWEMSIGGESTRRDALQQKVHSLLVRDWQRAARTQREIAAAFPSDPTAWKDAFYLDLEITPHGAIDSLKSWHRTRLAELDRTYRGSSDVTADIASGMMWYALGVEDNESASEWRRVLLQRFPTAPRAIEQRVMQVDDDPVLALQQLEALWAEAEASHPFLPQTASLRALQLGDPAAAERWLSRYAGMRPEVARWAAVNLTRFPQTRPRALVSLREQVSSLKQFDDSRRPLDLTRSDFRSESAGAIADAIVQLARALLVAGDTTQAELALRDAVQYEWHPSGFETLGSLSAARGDVVEAAAFLARAAADPASRVTLDSARSVIGDAFDQEEWDRALRRATRELAERVLSGALAIPLREEIPLRDASGAETQLSRLIDRRPTVIAFWSPYCGPSIESLPRIETLAAKLAASGANLILVTTEPLDERARVVLGAAGVTISPYVDATRALTIALNHVATPAFYVLDGQGRRRFPSTALSRVERQVAAILLESGTLSR